MKESEERRALIVHTFETLSETANHELEDVLTLAKMLFYPALAVLAFSNESITQLNTVDDSGSILFSVGNPFCEEVIKEAKVLEILDPFEDVRFKSKPLISTGPQARYYAGSPVTLRDGTTFGSLCLIDYNLRQLTSKQKSMFNVLASQIATILNLEVSMNALKNETLKLQESELKLKSIFQSSPHAHIFIDEYFNVRAFNVAAAAITMKLNNKALKEGLCIFDCINPNAIEALRGNIIEALKGKATQTVQNIKYSESQEEWWGISVNPVKNHIGNIIGASIDSTNVTESVRSRQEIISQNEKLKSIAFLQSHEMRRPVANIQGILPLLADSYDDSFYKNYQLLSDEVEALDKQIRNIVIQTHSVNLIKARYDQI